MSENQEYRFAYKAEGGDLFLLYLKNAVLTILTLGIYSAWAKAALYRFYFGNVEVAGSRLHFSGTGKEILRGLLIVGGVLIAANFGQTALTWMFLKVGLHWMSIAVGAAITIVFIYLWQLAVFSSLRYRCTRLSLRGIHFGLTGSAKEFAQEGLKRMLLAFLTLGILYPAYTHWKTKTLLSQMRFGNVAFSFDASKEEYVKRAWTGFFLILITLGIYFPFFYPKWLAFKRNHTLLGESRFNLNFTASSFIKTYVKMTLLQIFTLGIAAPWVLIMWVHFFIQNTTLNGPTRIEDALLGQSTQGSGIGEVLGDQLDVDSGLDLGL